MEYAVIWAIALTQQSSGSIGATTGGIAPTKRAYSEQNTIDRTFLNKEISSFEKVVPTAEYIAVRIGQLWRPVRELRAELHKIKLIESPNNSCEIYGAGWEEVAALCQQPEAVLAGVRSQKSGRWGGFTRIFG